MRTYFIIACICCGAVASAADYYLDVKLDGNGGAFAVESGESKVVSEDSTYEEMYVAKPYLGGAIYVGENASLELQGTHTFIENAHLAEPKGSTGTWWGDYNDIYLDKGATVILNTQDADDVISLGSGLSSSEDGGTTVIKKGEGKVVVGSDLADYTTMYTDFRVEEGTAEMRSSVNTTAIRVASDAEMIIDTPSLNPSFPVGLLVGTMWAEEISVNPNGEEPVRLSGVEVSANGISGMGDATGSISGASIAFYVGEGTQVSVNNVSLVDSNFWVEAGYDLSEGPVSVSNISLDANSGIWCSVETLLFGDNYIELGSLSSSQLEGVTLGDGAALTLYVSEELLAGEPETFNIILEDLALAEGATVTFDVQTAEGSNFSYAVTDYAPVSGGLQIQMTTAAVPEPTTATLSLLALAALVARRRRAA